MYKTFTLFGGGNGDDEEKGIDKNEEKIQELSHVIDQHAMDIQELQEFKSSFHGMFMGELVKELKPLKDHIMRIGTELEYYTSDLKAGGDHQASLGKQVHYVEEMARANASKILDLAHKASSIEAWVHMSKQKEAGQVKELEDMATEDQLHTSLLKLDMQVRELRSFIPREIEAKMKLLKEDSYIRGGDVADVKSQLPPPPPSAPAIHPDQLDAMLKSVKEEIMLQVRKEQMKTLRAVQPLVNDALQGLPLSTPAGGVRGSSDRNPSPVPSRQDDDDAEPRAAIAPASRLMMPATPSKASIRTSTSSKASRVVLEDITF
mmetsp:Transcript_69194/g.165919  ORF Transcript_69194/g.165919 Transcript_69194/m.165919 type:complete len:319 (+) Transcript_69194:65-1021(+)